MRIDEMSRASNGQEWPRIGAVVDAYEAALARDGAASLADFAPPADHPERLEILCELVRVDLEHQWQCGRPPRLEDYRGTLSGGVRGSRTLARHGLRGIPPATAGRRASDSGRVSASIRSRRLRLAKSAGVPGGVVLQPRRGRWTWTDPAISADGMAQAASAYRAYRHAGTGQADELEVQFSLLRVPPEQAEFFVLWTARPRMRPSGWPRLSAAFRGSAPTSSAFGSVASLAEGRSGESISLGRATWPIGWWH